MTRGKVVRGHEQDLFVPARPAAGLYKDTTPPPRYPQGRTCTECPTILSAYNSLPVCAVHDPSKLLIDTRPRDERITDMVRRGMSLATVGGLFDLTSEAVRKVAAKHGVRATRTPRKGWR